MSAHDAYMNDPRGPRVDTPVKDVSRWREAAAGAAVDEGGLGPVRIQRGGSATDDQQPEVTGGLSTSKPAQDGGYKSVSDGEPRFTATRRHAFTSVTLRL